MGSSLFDQLKKAGLADKSQTHKARVAKHEQGKQRRQGVAQDQTAQELEQARREKVERDRQLNADRKAEADRRALTAQIRQIVETHRQPRGVDPRSDEGVSYNFAEDGKVKSIRVSKAVQQQLSRGQLAIVKGADSYELVPKVIAERIALRDPAWFVTRNETVEVEGEDDPYKDYKIPDDLMW